MNDATPNLGPCPYLELPNGGFRVRLLDPPGDQIGEVDCDTEDDAIEISQVRPLLYGANPSRGQFDSTLAALDRAGVTASNAVYVRRLRHRRDEMDA